MSNGGGTGDNNANEELTRAHDVEALRLTQKETRAVLDHQIQTFNDIDDKATRTSRLDAILLGLILTAASFLAQSDTFDVTPYLNNASALGIALLIMSFIFAILTFTTTNIETGTGPYDIQRLIDTRYTEKEWLILLLRSEAAWMKENERKQSLNGTLLSISHGSLILGVVFLSAGVLLVHWSL